MCVGTTNVISIIFNHSFLQCYARTANKEGIDTNESNNCCLQTIRGLLLLFYL